jgi:hypothetical protein
MIFLCGNLDISVGIANTLPVRLVFDSQQGHYILLFPLALSPEANAASYYATSRKVAGSRLDEVNEFFQCT